MNAKLIIGLIGVCLFLSVGASMVSAAPGKCVKERNAVICFPSSTRTAVPLTPTLAPLPTPIVMRGCIDGLEYVGEYTTRYQSYTVNGVNAPPVTWTETCVDGEWQTTKSK